MDIHDFETKTDKHVSDVL